MRDFLYDIILLGLIVMSAGGYVFYRDAQSNKLSHIESFERTQSAAPTVCRLKSGDFEKASVGVMYVRGGRIAFDVTSTGGTNPGHLRVLIEKDGAHFVDPDTQGTLPIGASAEQQVDFVDNIIFSNTWRCSPWWIPNDSVFNIPKPIPE